MNFIGRIIDGFSSSLQVARWGSGAGEVDQVRMDASTNSLQTITYEHHEVHAGSHFNYCEYALNQGNGATIELILTTPNTTTWPHLTFEFSSSEGATLELYEGASGITAGTAITPRNNNRNSATAATMTLIKDPSAITSDGTRIDGFLAGGSRTSGFASRGKENVLDQNTIYLARITSLAVSNDISWCMEWYEHASRH